MSYTRILIHAVWGTKHRFPYLTKKIRQVVIDHILENAKSKQIRVIKLNGVTDHLHFLFYLPGDMSIAKAIMLIKGESSFWINKQKLTPEKFEWADEYYAASVGESEKKVIEKYIDEQESHHQRQTYTQECEDFLRNYMGNPEKHSGSGD